MSVTKTVLSAVLGALSIFGACAPDDTEVAEVSQGLSEPTQRCYVEGGQCNGGGGGGGSSCFEAETPILAANANGAWEWIPAYKIESGTQLAALDETSTLRAPRFQARAIKALSQDKAVSSLRVFTLANGRVLKVTPNHPMLLNDGRVIAARTLNVGAKLVSQDGSIVRVSDIAIEHAEREVYNFEVEATDPTGHTIVAGDVLSPDLWWQNKLATGN